MIGHCRDCQRPLRPRGTNPADYPPGSRVMEVFGLCVAHYRARRTSTPVLPRVYGAATCPGCDRRTRPAAARLSDYPETVPRRAGGFCGTCHHDGTAETIIAARETLTRWTRTRKATP